MAGSRACDAAVSLIHRVGVGQCAAEDAERGDHPGDESWPAPHRHRTWPRPSAEAAVPGTLTRTVRVLAEEVGADIAVLADQPALFGRWPRTARVGGCSSVDHALQLLGVTLALHLDGSRGLVEFGDVVRCDGEAGGADVLVEPLEPPGTGNGSDPRCLREQPAERDLCGGRLLRLSDPTDEIDDGLVGLPGFGREAGDHPADVIGGELG